LRERKGDIPALAEYLLQKHTPTGAGHLSLTPELKTAWTAYQWPGNVRELENVMRRFVVLRDPGLIASEMHLKASRGVTARSAPGVMAAPILEQVSKAKQEAEAEAILAALHSTRWNRKHAAAVLNIDYKALLYKMKKLDLDSQSPNAGAARRESARSFGTPTSGNANSVVMESRDFEVQGKRAGTIRFSSKLA
jgi:two-component system, NtrC family, response regulator AtoC